MICVRCGGPYRWYAPWYEPLENHYLRCLRCNHTDYTFGPDDEYHPQEQK